MSAGSKHIKSNAIFDEYCFLTGIDNKLAP